MKISLPRISRLFLAVLALSALAHASINVSSPSSTSVTSPVRFVVSASSSKPITGMRLYVDGVEKFRTSTSKIDTQISMASGTRKVVIKAWDSGGYVQSKSWSLSVSSSTSTSTTSSTSSSTKTYGHLEDKDGWEHCSKCAADPSDSSPPIAKYSMSKYQKSPSKDGHSAKFWLGGSTPYANALWWKKLTTNKDEIRSKRNYVYEMYFYYTNSKAPQALEFDLNVYIDGRKHIFGTQCNIRGGAQWDVWDNVNKKWVKTGASCYAPPTYKWNLLQIEFRRTSDNKLHYVSFTLNGKKQYVNRYYSPGKTDWTGMTPAFQLDGNNEQTDYSVWVERFKLITW